MADHECIAVAIGCKIWVGDTIGGYARLSGSRGSGAGSLGRYVKPTCKQAVSILTAMAAMADAGPAFSIVSRVRWSQNLCRQASNSFRGVYWRQTNGKYQSSVYFNKMMHHVGSFGCELQAAKAFDARLRSLCEDGVRLKKSLNFPTVQEANFQKCQLEAREDALRAQQNRLRTEEESFRTLLRLFQQSSEAPCYEIVRIGGFARADALFRPVGSVTGIRLQIKSSTARGPNGLSYRFSKTNGYEGMLLILVAPDIKMCWTVAGGQVLQKHIAILLGSDRDRCWRAQDIGATLQSCLQDETAFPHTSLCEARLQCSSTAHQVEQCAHFRMVAVFSAVNCRLRQSIKAAATVDSVLQGEGFNWRVQEKAANFRQSAGGYAIALCRRRGKHYTGYEETDFDLLMAAALDAERLSGLFVFPVRVLAEHGFVGQKPAFLPLHPPWSLPKTKVTQIKYAWQLEYFVDLRSWSGKLPLSFESCTALRKLLKKLRESCEKALLYSDIDNHATVPGSLLPVATSSVTLSRVPVRSCRHRLNSFCDAASASSWPVHVYAQSMPSPCRFAARIDSGRACGFNWLGHAARMIVQAAAKAITKSALDAAEKSFASGGLTAHLRLWSHPVHTQAASPPPKWNVTAHASRLRPILLLKHAGLTKLITLSTPT